MGDAEIFGRCRASGRLRSAAAGAGLASLLAAVAGCGHAIAPGIPFQHAPRFDFRRPPPCADAPPPERVAQPDDVVVRYLGASGLYVGWRGEALLADPFFSNPGLLRVGLGRMRHDRAAIRRGLDGVPTERVGAILVGHSHYDHLGDLPVVAGELAPNATLYVNRSGANALAPYVPPGPRLRVLESLADTGWIRLADATGRRLPFRILPVVSHHAPHLGPIALWRGTTPPSAEPWERRRYGALKAGNSHAFVLDLLDGPEEGAAVRFRLYMQGSAAEEPWGLPPPPATGDPHFDLAVVCVASSQWVRPYPRALLDRIRPQHVLVTHYEDFFRPWGPRRGFVPPLTRRIVDDFLRRVDGTLDTRGVVGTLPVSSACGPSSPRWTMPLTGEWMVFRPSPVGGSLPLG